MKIRTGFVSNSSSSSFVVISERKDKEEFDEKELKYLFNSMDEDDEEDWNGLFPEGECKFGWQVKNYHDAPSKWNWLVLQAFYAQMEGDFKFVQILEDYAKELNPRLVINLKKLSNEENELEVYIDHQSIYPEDTFDKIKEIGISRWLMDYKCYVHNSNDNL